MESKLKYVRFWENTHHHKQTHTRAQGWTSKVSVRRVITSSQRGGELRESESPGEKRIMRRERGAALRLHTWREDA